MNIKWPDGKKFAFTIFDDTDLGTVENLSPVYDFLFENGFRTTKSVWTIKGNENPKVGGLTCEDADYLKWVKEIQKKGFEIASHCVTYHTSKRNDTERGIEEFHKMFGHYPFSFSTHSGCYEGIYNGMYRVSGVNRFIYNLLTRYKHYKKYNGHIEGLDTFWGDICKEKIKYVRGYVYGNINTLTECPQMPYHDPQKPFVNYWYASTEGADVNSFVNTISEKNQDKLESEGGACIMYTHLSCGFYENGRLNEKFEHLMKRLSEKGGWFVPVNVLLDFLLEQKKDKNISFFEEKKLETKWLLHKLFVGAT